MFQLRMNRKYQSLFLTLLLSFTVVSLTLIWLVGQSQQAQAASVIHFVAPGGVCGVSPCYSSIQAAVNAAAEGDEIRVAAGTYQGVQTIPALNTPYLTATQLIVLTKSLFIRGGYLTSDWDTANPAAHPTILDAAHQGRVFFVTGQISSTIEGFHIIHGNADNLGGRYQWWNDSTGDVGAGLLILTATVTIRQTEIMSNAISPSPVYGIANLGGGMYVKSESLKLEDSLIAFNEGDCTGGVYLDGISIGSIRQNQFIGNSASGANCYTGGGLYVFGSNILVEANTFNQNSAYGGGGLSVNGGVTVRDNNIYNNSAIYGGGLFVEGGAPLIIGNVIQDNEVSQAGSGVAFWSSQPLFVNNVINHNRDSGAFSWGGGIFAGDGQAELTHNTLVDNDGSGILVRNWGSGGTVLTMTNNIIVDHQVGVTVTAGNTATLSATLWGSGTSANAQDWGGSGTIASSLNIWDSPAFAPDGYHLTHGSAALNAGIGTSISDDIDRQSRALGGLPDLGADELIPLLIINYENGAPGSYFTLTGSAFPPNYTASVIINGRSLGSVPTDANGNFTFLLNSTGAEEGAYLVSATVNPTAIGWFTLDSALETRPQEGDTTIFVIPTGIAFNEFLFLPAIVR